MYNGLICVCDFDGEVLRGKVGTAEVHKRYLEIKGAYDICIQDYDDGKGNQFTYVTDKIRKERMHFCAHGKKNCLMEWILMKEKMYKNKRAEAYTERARVKQHDRQVATYWDSPQEA